MTETGNAPGGQMERRSFLRLFGLAAAAVGVSTACPEVLQKVVELAAEEGEILSLDEVQALAVKYIVPALVDDFFRTTGPVLMYLKKHGGVA